MYQITVKKTALNTCEPEEKQPEMCVTMVTAVEDKGQSSELVGVQACFSVSVSQELNNKGRADVWWV